MIDNDFTLNEFTVDDFDSSPRYTFTHLIVSYGRRMIDTRERGNSLLHVCGKEFSGILVQLEGVKERSGSESRRELMMELYREGESQPIARMEERPYGGECDMETSSGYIPAPGKYYVLINNALLKESEGESRFDEYKDKLRYTFYIKPNGELLEHPEVKSLSLSTDKRLYVELDHTLGELEDITFLCYNNDWELMAQIDELSFRRSPKGRAWLFPSLIWTEGDYFFVVLHNGEPFAHVSFTWRDGATPEMICTPIDSFSPYYILGKYLEKEATWRELRKMPGCTSIKKMLAERYACNAFNEVRLSYGLERWKEVYHCALVGDDECDFNLLYAFSQLTNPYLSFKECDCASLLEQSGSIVLADLKSSVGCCDDTVLCLTHLSALTASKGILLLKVLEEKVSKGNNCALVLSGTQAEVCRTLEMSAFLKCLVPEENFYHLQPYSLTEQIHCAQRILESYDLSLTAEVRKRLVDVLTEHRKEIVHWREVELSDWLKKEVLACFGKRLLQMKPVDGHRYRTMLSTLSVEDIRFPEVEPQKDEFVEAMRELNAMVGLEQLKESLTNLFNRVRFDEKRRALGLPVPEKNGFHMVFTGNPGTGKTTVAKMVGRVFRSLGLLSKGEVIVTERSKILGRYIGDTENNMQALLEQAKGNVLFIDEAYNLYDGGDDRKDFGNHVLDSLLTVLSQKSPDMIVILAGYEKEMNRMLESNPGLKGRFPYRFTFEDYDAEELMQMAHNWFDRSQYLLTDAAERRLRETVDEAVRQKDVFFHNARWIEQYIQDGILTAMSGRLANCLWVEDRRLYQTIELEDVEKGYRVMKPQLKEVAVFRRKIGFVA